MLIGLVALVGGCAALAIIILIAADDQREVAKTQKADAGREPPPESIDVDSLQSINPVNTVPRNRRLRGREGKRWAERLIGLSFQEADALAAPRGMSVRIIELDGSNVSLSANVR